MNNREVFINKGDIKDCNNGYGNLITTAKAEQKAFCVDVNSDTLGNCVNTPVGLNPITGGAVAKIPVVLAELAVRFNVSSKIDLPEPALEIKNIKKKLKITQCLLLQDTNILFVKGFVRKNIDYSTRSCANVYGVCGDIRHCTVEVPFECTTAVTFNSMAPAPVINSTSDEFQYSRTKTLPNNFAEKDKLLSGDLSEYNQISTEYYNDLPFCELISSRIVEFDEHLYRVHPKCTNLPVGENLFTAIEEKMVIDLTLKILQERQVAIGPTAAIRNCPTT